MGGLSRNKPCHCGSSKKYKKCCLRKDEEDRYNDQEMQLSRGADPFASDDDWEDESDGQWEDTPKEEWKNEDDHDTAGSLSAPVPERNEISKVETKILSEDDETRINVW